MKLLKQKIDSTGKKIDEKESRSPTTSSVPPSSNNRPSSASRGSFTPRGRGGYTPWRGRGRSMNRGGLNSWRGGYSGPKKDNAAQPDKKDDKKPLN